MVQLECRRAGRGEGKSWFYHLLAVWLGASYLMSRSLSSSFCKKEINIISTFEGFSENYGELFSFNLFTKYLFSTCYVPGTGAAAMKKMCDVSAPVALTMFCRVQEEWIHFSLFVRCQAYCLAVLRVSQHHWHPTPQNVFIFFSWQMGRGFH